MIKFLVKKEAAIEIHPCMVAVYGQESRCPLSIHGTAMGAQFKRGRESLENPRSGRPLDATSAQNVTLVEKLIMADRQVTVDEIATEVKFSHDTIDTIIREHLMKWFLLVESAGTLLCKIVISEWY